jgi:thioredoxin reductase (NADPH)
VADIDGSEGLAARLDRLPGAEVARLQARFDRRHVSAGEALVREGEVGAGLWLLLAGSAAVWVQDADGARDVLVEVGPGAWIGELSFLDPGPASATVTAAVECVALRMDADSLDRLCVEEPELAGKLLQALSRDVAARLRAWDAGVAATVEARDDRGLLARLFGGGR